MQPLPLATREICRYRLGIMNRGTEAARREVCVRQRTDVDAQEWLNFPHPVKSELAAAALFLACVDWYGHQPELREIALTLEPGCVGHFSDLARRTRFDCGRFSNMLRYSLRHAQLAS